jgi:hypothetical protein
MIIEIPCSMEQEDVIADHLFYGHELGVLASEKIWIKNYLQKKAPGKKLLKAELIIEDAVWKLHLQSA